MKVEPTKAAPARRQSKRTIGAPSAFIRGQNPLPAAARHRTPGHGARTCPRQQPKPSPRAYSSPAAAAAREAGVSISSGATGPSYVYPKNARRSGLVMFSQPGYGFIAFGSGLNRRM